MDSFGKSFGIIVGIAEVEGCTVLFAFVFLSAYYSYPIITEETESGGTFGYVKISKVFYTLSCFFVRNTDTSSFKAIG